MTINMQTLSPYLRLMRLHQPVGIWLLLWPCWWSATLASFAVPLPKTLFLFALGAILMRSAGCVVNDIIDRDLDKHVERTRLRPLASGELSIRQAFVLLFILCLLSLTVAMMLGIEVTSWAAASLILIVAYPWMKRITWWPQLFLGLTFNWGALLGWVAVAGEVTTPALWIYAGGIFWTLGYDTIYAHQDKADDRKVGIKSTALRLGDRTKRFVRIFYTISIIFWGLAGYTGSNNILFYSFLALSWLHLNWQVSSVDLDNPDSCKRVFKSNAWFGALVFFAFLGGKM